MLQSQFLHMQPSSRTFWPMACSVMSYQITVTAKYKTQHKDQYDSCLRTKKGLQGGKTIQQRSEFFASRGPYCFYQFSGSCPCALCTHMCVSTTLSLLSFAWLPHCWSFIMPCLHISAWCPSKRALFCQKHEMLVEKRNGSVLYPCTSTACFGRHICLGS